MPRVGVEQQRKRQVMNAVLKCIIEEGMEKISIDRIAAKAGLSKGVIFYYFTSKKKLLVETFEYFLNGYFDSVQASLSKMEGLDDPAEFLLLVGKVVIGIDKLIFDDFQLSPEESGEVITQLYSKAIVDKDFRNIYVKMYNDYSRAIKEIFLYARKAGKWLNTDVEATVTQLMAMLEGLLVFRAVGYIDEDTAFRSYSEFVKKLN